MQTGSGLLEKGRSGAHITISSVALGAELCWGM